MTHVSLFTGIGGLDLAAEWAGFETVLQVEMDDYANKVLEKHWPNVKRIKDIKDVNRESVSEPITVISGGFPCQPFSAAGKRGGREDDRYLWPEMLRVIKEFEPDWVIAENVENAVRMVSEEIVSNLEKSGYEAAVLSLSAYCSGAWFSGKRMFILASSVNRRAPLWRDAQFHTNETVKGCGGDNRRGAPIIDARKRWESESRPIGVVNGISSRVDRLKCLGNAVVPQQAYPIFKAIAEVENCKVIT